jgi:hypothetical protein
MFSTALVLYPLSIGPVASIYRFLMLRGLMPACIEAALTTVYYPLQWLHENGPTPIIHALDSYVAWRSESP